MSKPRLSFGTDPEFMLQNRDGYLVSAIPILQASKEKKIDLGAPPRHDHKMFYDNVLVEFNVKTSYSEEELVNNLSDCFRLATKYIRGYLLHPQSSVIYPASECKHKDALVFGCEPEYCCYEMAQLNPPVCEPGNCFRSAGGHIHLGYDGEGYPLMAPPNGDDHSERDWGRVWVVRMMDVFVGLPSLLIDHDKTSAARRKLYGKAGTHRPKEEYGVEYRATSNFWLRSPQLARLIYKLSAFTVDFVRDKRQFEMWEDESTCKMYNIQELRETIDGSNIMQARKFMEKIVKPFLPEDLYVEIFHRSEPVQYDFYNEWGL
jgi:hypothetical protein